MPYQDPGQRQQWDNSNHLKSGQILLTYNTTEQCYVTTYALPVPSSWFLNIKKLCSEFSINIGKSAHLEAMHCRYMYVKYCDCNYLCIADMWVWCAMWSLKSNTTTNKMLWYFSVNPHWGVLRNLREVLFAYTALECIWCGCMLA